MRAAALSALAIGMVGGVNAAATSAVLPLGVLWLLTRERGPRRRALLVWWPVFTAVATLWWLVPLFTLGAYSPPFLDFIESAGVTTFPATPFDALRGTTAWVPYLDPGWGGGVDLVRQSYLVLNSGILLVVGLAGLAARATPNRRFLALALLVGLLLTTLGHQGSTAGWGAGTVADLLDGPLAPLRNIHKFDPVVRIPLALGLAWALEHAARHATWQRVTLRGRTRRVSTRWPVTALTALAVAGSAMPAALGTLTPADPVLATPTYWQQAVDWLDEQEDETGATALYAPGTSFGTYRWGEPRDEPFQYLGDHGWAVRNAVPLTPPGTIRYLDAVEEVVSTGAGSPALAAALRRAGVGYVVVRNDLAPGNDVPDPVLMRQALERSPGLSRTRSFGPEVGGEAVLEGEDGRRLLVNGGWQDRRDAIEVWALDDPPGAALAAGDPIVLVGGPEDVLGGLEAGVLGETPTRLGLDTPTSQAPPGGVVLTDGLVERERTFGRVHDATGEVRVPGDRLRSSNPVTDYDLAGWDAWRTTGRLDGAESVTASASGSDIDTAGGADRAAAPYAAVDGDPATAWRGSAGAGEQAFWRIDLDEPTDSRQATLTAPADAPDSVRVGVVTASGRGGTAELTPGATVQVELPEGGAEWLRVEELASGNGRLALAEVGVPGVEVERPLVLPAVPEAWGAPARVLLRRLDEARTGCASVGGRTPCRESQARQPEERRVLDRVVELPAAQGYDAAIRVRGLPGPALADLVQEGQVLAATASSTGPRDLRAAGVAALDGDPGTTWTPRLDDPRPTLTVRFAEPRTIRRLTLGLDPAAPARRVTEATLVWPEGRRRVTFDERGRADLAEAGRGGGGPIRTSSLEVRVTDSADAASIDAAGVGEPLPPGVGELRVNGLDAALSFDTDERTYPCGSGPAVSVNGSLRETRVVGAPADIVAGEPVTARLCSPGPGFGGDQRLALRAGENRVRLAGSELFVPDRVVLSAPDAPPVDAADTAALPVESDPARREVDPPAGAGTVVLHQNVNPGWAAGQGGEPLAALAADGWQQAWFLDGEEPVVADFAPDRTYRVGLLVGLALLLALALACAFLPRRRWPRADDPSLAASALGGGPASPASTGRHRAGGGRAALSGASTVVVVAAGLLVGWPGVLAAALGFALALGAARFRAEAAPWLAASPVALAAVAYAVRPWGDPSGWAGSLAWPGYAVVLGVSAAVVLAWGRPGSVRDDRFRRRAGTSTNR